MAKKEIKRTDKMGFEITECSRCGGTGQFSYCQAYGTMCFGCSGTGVVRTRRGTKAYNAFHKSMNAPVSDIKVGDMIFESKRWRKLISVEPNIQNPGYITLEFKGYSSHIFADSTVETVRDEDHRQELLKKAVKSQ